MFERVTPKLQFRFKDRVSAANILGESLKDVIPKQEKSSLLVLGIPRGGLVTADIANFIASKKSLMEQCEELNGRKMS